jgi:hypothetical protein
MPSWADLERRRAELPAVPKDEDADEIIARLLMTPDGRVLLAWLRARTVEFRSPPGAPDASLRELEGARRLVGDIEQARDRGTAKLAKQTKPAA